MVPDDIRVSAWVLVAAVAAVGLTLLAAWAIYGWVPRC